MNFWRRSPFLVKYGPLAIGGAYLIDQLDDIILKEYYYEKRIRHIFKHYEQTGENKRIKI